MKIRRTFVAVCLLAAAAIGAPGPAAGTSQAALRIVRPEPDQTIAGGNVVVEIEVEGVVLGGRTRNGAYALLTLDDMPPVKSLAPRFTFRNVPAGEHLVLAELRRPDGSRFEPEVEVRVRFRTQPRP